MSNIELPFNVKQISKKELDNLIKRVKKGEEDIYLEVRDNEKNLIGFQKVLSLKDNLKIAKRRLIYLIKLNSKYSRRKSNKEEAEKIKEEIELCIKEIQAVLGRSFLVDDRKDFVDKINSIEPYMKKEISKKMDFDKNPYVR
mgnify:CR=1 FL=1